MQFEIPDGAIAVLDNLLSNTSAVRNTVEGAKLSLGKADANRLRAAIRNLATLAGGPQPAEADMPRGEDLVGLADSREAARMMRDQERVLRYRRGPDPSAAPALVDRDLEAEFGPIGSAECEAAIRAMRGGVTFQAALRAIRARY
jgi:hypothetical protein